MKFKPSNNMASDYKRIATPNGEITETYSAEQAGMFKSGKVLGTYMAKPPYPKDLTPEQRKQWDAYWEEQISWWMSESMNQIRSDKWSEPGRKFD